MSNTRLPGSVGGDRGVDETPEGRSSEPAAPDHVAAGVNPDRSDVGEREVGRSGARPADAGEPGDRLPPAVVVAAASAATVLVLDQVTKIWAVSALEGRDIDLFWTLRLHLIRNTGSAFGIGSQFGRVLAVVVVAVVVGVIAYLRRVTDRRVALLLGAVVGGAVGNLVDRIVRADGGFLSGGVVDFIDLQWWPIFNVADMAVVCGALGLAVLSTRHAG